MLEVERHEAEMAAREGDQSRSTYWCKPISVHACHQRPGRQGIGLSIPPAMHAFADEVIE
jgi:hypothetical protein